MKRISLPIILGSLCCILFPISLLVYSTPVPKPVIIDKGIKDTSTLFDFRQTVWAVVKNNGISGNITVKAVIYQGSMSEDRIETICVLNGTTKRVELEFPEVKRLNGRIDWSIKAFVQSKEDIRKRPLRPVRHFRKEE